MTGSRWAGRPEVMRLLLIALFATLLLAAPASAARFQHNGPDVDFTIAASDTVRITVTGHKLGDPRQLTFTRGTGGTRVHHRRGLLDLHRYRYRALLRRRRDAACGFTTNERARH